MDDLNISQKTHVGKTEYPCDVCNKSFNSKIYMSIQAGAYRGETVLIREM